MRDMIDSIIARHGVTRTQFAAAERDRVWWADLLVVFLPMAVLAVIATAFITRRICRSFDRALICLSTAAFTFRRTWLSASRRFAYGRRSALT